LGNNVHALWGDFIFISENLGNEGIENEIMLHHLNAL